MEKILSVLYHIAMIEKTTLEFGAPDNRSPKRDDEAFVRSVFKSHDSMLSVVVKKALRIQEMTARIDPFIQQHTSIVCPQCDNVCCINKHGKYDYDDIVCLCGLGVDLPHSSTDRSEKDPCRFLTPTGCSLARYVRPFRCNWHFCPDLISSIEKGPARPYRTFIEQFQEIQRLRAEMREAFERVRLKADHGESG